MPALLSALTGWLLFAALVTALGGFSAKWILVPRAFARGNAGAPTAGSDSAGLTVFGERVAARLALAGIALLPLAVSLVLWRQLLEFRDPFAPWSEEAELLLTGTAWGSTWTRAALTTLVALLAGIALRAGLRLGWVVACACVLGLAAFPGLTGHAAGTEALRPVTLVADWLHVLAAGAWVGGLSFVVFAERSWRASNPGETLLPELVPAFSPSAVVSVGVLIVTGTLASWIHLESLPALLSTAYGRTLLVKLAFVGAVMVLGAVNWKRLTPRLEERSGQAALRRNATLELVVAQVVLLITAVLIRTSPLGH